MAPEFCTNAPARTEGAGKAGCPSHPRPRVRNKKHTSKSTTGSPETPGLPCAMVLTVSFALFPVTGLDCHRRSRRTSPRELSTSVGVPEPHDFAVRSRLHKSHSKDQVPVPPKLPRRRIKRRSSCAATASTASRPTFGDDGQRPSFGRDGGITKGVSSKRPSEIFLRKGLDVSGKSPGAGVRANLEFCSAQALACLLVATAPDLPNET
jgi:hypothetical protein